MSDIRVPYSATQLISKFEYDTLDLQKWEKDLLLQIRMAARSGTLVVCDPDSRCWWTTGKMQCSKEDRQELPFKI